MFLGSYLKTALATNLNILLYLLTGGRFIWLEGRVRRGTCHNWGRRFRFRPGQFARPETEDEIVTLVRNAERIRVIGAGHSFNAGIVTDATLLSLDRYQGMLWKDVEKKQMAFKAGTRIRDVNRALFKEGWAFSGLPSHDAQSIGGIISTDVHGTGRDWGFVSEAVVSLKLVDGHGQVVECTPDDDLYRAAIGGIGAPGIIIEVVVQAVDAFRVRQKTELRDLAEIEANLDQLLEENEHLSLYIFAFSDKCHLNTWNRTSRDQTLLGRTREFVNSALDAWLAVWIADLLAHTRLLPRFSRPILRLDEGGELVLESSEAFNRTIYYPHHELEFAVPYEETFPVLRRFIDLYEEHYRRGTPFVAFELRFTPTGHRRTLIGPGRERQSTWLDLLVNDSAGYEAFLEAAEAEVQAIGARPHLGKHCRAVDHAYLAQVHGENFTRFCELVRERDPDGKFANAFTRRLFESRLADETKVNLL